MGLDYTSILQESVQQDQIAVMANQIQQYQQMMPQMAHIPAMAQQMAPQDPEMISKAWKNMSRDTAKRAPKSAFFDPLSLQYALGYKDRRYSLTYDTLRRISHQLSIVAGIINTRIAQIAAFCEPYRITKSLGFQIRHKDPDHMTTASERRFIQQLEAFVLNCGEPGRQNPFTRVRRPKFESFLKMTVRDTLTFDQMGFEIVPRRNQIPFEFRAVDATTLRLASPERDASEQRSLHQRNPIHQNAQMVPYRFANMYAGQRYGVSHEYPLETVQYVQVVNGQIENVYTDNEMAFGVRNPRTDIYVQGYGFGELEQLVTIVTAMLWAEEYNRRFFTQGAHPKGILNFKGDNWTPDQLEAFKRLWVAQVAGTENSWKTPITQSEGIEWVNMQISNQDMQFNIWLEYLIKVSCAVYLIDPAEINFDLHGGVQQTPLFESSQEWKLKASRDRGLKPLLRFFASQINEHVIDRIDDHFVFEFAGLDELTEQEKHEMMKEQIGSYMTLNEGRRSLDLPDIPGGVGDVPLNPTLIQLMQFIDQRQEREAQQAQESQQAEQEAAAQQQQGEQEVPPEQDPQVQMQAQAHEQKLRHAEEKHPLEMQMMAQKMGQEQLNQQAQAQQMQMQGAAMQGAQPMEGAQPAEAGAVEGGQVVEEAPQDPRKDYADLFGKSINFDDWLDIMRSRRV